MKCERCKCEIEKEAKPTMVSIVAIAADYFGQEVKVVMGKSRRVEDIKPRQYAMYFMNKIGYTPKEIFSFFKYRNHTSIITTRRSVDNRFASSQDDLADYNKFTSLIKN